MFNTTNLQETQGVCIATFGPRKEFPAFYTERSGVYVSYNVENAGEAACLIHTFLESKLDSGLLIAVPIPEEYAVAGKTSYLVNSLGNKRSQEMNLELLQFMYNKR